jgi:hypothetical protein
MNTSETGREAPYWSCDARGVTYKAVCALAQQFPGLTQGSCHGTPALIFRGNLLARLRTEADRTLAIRCDLRERGALLQSDPSAFFLTEHCAKLPQLLVRLDKVRRCDLHHLMYQAWRSVAPRSLVAKYERSQAAASDPSEAEPIATESAQPAAAQDIESALSYLDSLPLVSALWWFIENAAGEEWRSEALLHLRERVREETPKPSDQMPLSGAHKRDKSIGANGARAPSRRPGAQT